MWQIFLGHDFFELPLILVALGVILPAWQLWQFSLGAVITATLIYDIKRLAHASRQAVIHAPRRDLRLVCEFIDIVTIWELVS